MARNIQHILLLEPYYGGSHRAFLDGLQKHLPFDFTLISLPARKWKMRMQLAAPWMADEVFGLVKQGNKFDCILCSTFIDVATLRILLLQKGLDLPVAVYFHENQFAYPNQVADPGRYQFTFLNFTSALAADAVAFNSNYNRETFMAGVSGYLKKATDMEIRHKVDELWGKSSVLYPGIDFAGFEIPSENHENGKPVLVWNHRWEHDKDPETFFESLFSLSHQGIGFDLIVLGQHFERCPDIFSKAEKMLANHIIHFGYLPDKEGYIRMLCKSDLVVSTAVHEFFGMAVLEAVRCGCRPLVPDRLSYRELFPAEYRYSEGGFGEALAELLLRPQRLEKEISRELTETFSWTKLAAQYEQWLISLL